MDGRLIQYDARLLHPALWAHSAHDLKNVERLNQPVQKGRHIKLQIYWVTCNLWTATACPGFGFEIRDRPRMIPGGRYTCNQAAPSNYATVLHVRIVRKMFSYIAKCLQADGQEGRSNAGPTKFQPFTLGSNNWGLGDFRTPSLLSEETSTEPAKMDNLRPVARVSVVIQVADVVQPISGHTGWFR
eukprot:1180585-Prorocentrum_minimum.AAC.3